MSHFWLIPIFGILAWVGFVALVLHWFGVAKDGARQQ